MLSQAETFACQKNNAKCLTKTGTNLANKNIHEWSKYKTNSTAMTVK